MKTCIFTSFILMTFNTLLCIAQEDFKSKYFEATDFLINENYEDALSILLELEQESKNNFNIQSSIGYCYMHTDFEKHKSVEYFEKILSDYKNMTIDYNFENFKEKKAPVQTLLWIGNAYHYNYQFDEALEKYREYKDLLDPDNQEMLSEVNKAIRTCKNAKAYKKSPTDAKIELLSILNSEHSEYRPKVNGDETELFFTTRRPLEERDNQMPDGKFFENIFVSKKVNGEWQEPHIVHSKINSISHDACLYVTPDGLSMIIYRTDPKNNKGGIYQSQKRNGEWTKPELMIAEVNSKYWETDANISADGNTLFYTSDKPGGSGGRDIWIMNRLPNGKWAKVQNAGPNINTEEDEESPYLHPDGKTLYFSSKRAESMGGFDVFYSEKQDDDTWGRPQNMGYPVNTTGDDVFYFPTNDGTRAYFSSYREGGMGQQDIYILELPKAEVKTLAIYKGLAKYTTGEIIKDLTITIINKKDNSEHGTYAPNSETGKFLFILKPGETFEVTYEVAGMNIVDEIVVPTSGGVQEIVKVITVTNNELVLQESQVVGDDIEFAIDDLMPSLPVEITELTQDELNTKLDAGESIILNDLYFHYDKAKLKNDSEVDLSKLIAYLEKHPNSTIRLEGHTDSKGDEKYNLKLSEKRCKTVKTKLAKSGVDKSRIETKGFGESVPIAKNNNGDGSDNPEGRQLNRRVEVKVINN